MEKRSAKNTRSSASPWRRRFKQLVAIVSTPRFAKWYVVFSLAVLLATTIFWSILSAKLQGGNADQLVNSYLFEHTNTFHNALFPGQHSMLLKWPIFLLIRILGISSATFVVFTVGLSVTTVAALAFIIYRIERRPLIFGTLCLALASVLLLVPAQPYAGGILPVNMAMLSTRNLEYILYICSLALLLSSPRVKSAKFWLAITGLSLLIASDKLFFVLSVGGALLALVVYAFASGWNLVSLTVHWVIGGLIATAAALGILGILNSSGITHISNQSVAGPFGVVENLHTLVKGTEYAVSGLLTNLGANPAFNDTPSTKIGHQAYVNLTGIGGLAFIINAAIAIGGFLIICSLIRAS